MYWPRVFRLCMGYTNDYSLAQDMAQETFLVIWKALPQFRGEANIETWIFRITWTCYFTHEAQPYHTQHPDTKKHDRRSKDRRRTV